MKKFFFDDRESEEEFIVAYGILPSVLTIVEFTNKLKIVTPIFSVESMMHTDPYKTMMYTDYAHWYISFR